MEKKTYNPCAACLSSSFSSRGKKGDYGIFSCNFCGTATAVPLPTPEELAVFYQSYKGTSDYLSKREKKISRSRKRIRKVMRFTEGKSFLDVGSNYGFAVKAALDLGLDAHGIDIDADTIDASRKMFGEHFTASCVQDYADSGRKADIVYTSEVIEHVTDPNKFMSSIARIMKPKAVLYLTTPDSGHWRLPKDFTSWPAVMPPEHLNLFTRNGISSLLSRNSLRVKSLSFSIKPGIKLIAVKD